MYYYIGIIVVLLIVLAKCRSFIWTAKVLGWLAFVEVILAASFLIAAMADGSYLGKELGVYYATAADWALLIGGGVLALWYAPKPSSDKSAPLPIKNCHPLHSV